MKKYIAASLLVVLLTSGCSNINSDPSDPMGEGQASTSSWECETTQDGLGDSIFCSSSVTDENNFEWRLSLSCSSELETFNSILGIRPNFTTVLWSVGDPDNIAKVRIDSEPVDEWLFGTKSGGEALAFAQLTTLDGDENASTWEFISRLEGAETFGFKAFDADGDARSVRFNVKNTGYVAESFSNLGCKG